MTHQLFEFVANGIFLGAIYALVATAMCTVWVTTDVIDIATGGYAVVAGLVAAAIGLPLGPVIGLAASLALGALTGVLFICFHALRVQRDAMLIVLGTFALMIAIESGVLTLLGTDSRFLDLITGSTTVGGFRLPLQGLANLAVSAVLMLALVVVINKSPLGLRMRASAISDRSAMIAGVAVRRTQFFTIMLCAGISGTAGILAVMSVGLTFASTFVLTTIALSGSILLGRPGPLSAFIGGIVLGMVTVISEAYLPSGWAAAVPAAVIILVLASGRMSATAFAGGRP